MVDFLKNIAALFWFLGVTAAVVLVGIAVILWALRTVFA
jgi:hypothetical protein